MSPFLVTVLLTRDNRSRTNILIIIIGVFIMTTQNIEIFLYIDPLGKRCNSVRKVISNFRTERPEKIKLRVIPMVNFKRVYGHARKRTNHDRATFADHNNSFSTNTYQACLAFHASAMQGKNNSHQFLTVLQEYVVENRIDFSEDLIYVVAEQIGLDMESFKEDYKSELVRKIYHKSLRLAADMQITGTPSCVIYKDGLHEDALRLGEEIEREILHTICGLEEIKEVEYGEEIHEEVKQELNNVFDLNLN